MGFKFGFVGAALGAAAVGLTGGAATPLLFAKAAAAGAAVGMQGDAMKQASKARKSAESIANEERTRQRGLQADLVAERSKVEAQRRREAGRIQEGLIRGLRRSNRPSSLNSAASQDLSGSLG
jgi:hypothetical protein